MTIRVSHTQEVQDLFKDASGFNNTDGDARTKEVFFRVLNDLAKIVEDLNISETEFWKAIDYLNRLGASGEFGLLVAGSSFEHFMDVLQDEKDRQANLLGGTPRTIEGPLYVAGAPVAHGEARMDDGKDDTTIMFLEGVVRDPAGQPVPNATVEVWHANSKGNYSFFDQSQSEYNLRRQIITDENGRYRARSIVPVGYGCPPEGPTQEALNQLGRHGQRPAHIHFFLHATGYRHLTTQINLAGDKYLWEDFAYATREGLVADINFIDDESKWAEKGVDRRYAEVNFDFQLQLSANEADENRSQRPRALQDTDSSVTA